jgi:hypothetical protein
VQGSHSSRTAGTPEHEQQHPAATTLYQQLRRAVHIQQWYSDRQLMTCTCALVGLHFCKHSSHSGDNSRYLCNAMECDITLQMT